MIASVPTVVIWKKDKQRVKPGTLHDGDCTQKVDYAEAGNGKTKVDMCRKRARMRTTNRWRHPRQLRREGKAAYQTEVTTQIGLRNTKRTRGAETY